MSVKVLIVDDSALVRQMLTEMLSSDPGIEVVGVAPDPLLAREKIKRLNPDVITLDVEMPKMDGLTFLRNLMRLRPMPVVMVSSLTENGAEVTLEALEVGAFDFVAKPKVDLAATLQDYRDEIVSKVKAAAKATIRPLADRSVSTGVVAENVPRPKRHFRTTDIMIAIGASTGGTEAVKEVLRRLPADAPACVISQHIPEAFSAPWAARMNRESRLEVAEARDGEIILPGHVYIAPGDDHLRVRRDGARFVCELSKGAPVNRHRPSVDVMFESIAGNVGPNAISVLLTGMGSDGAAGMFQMREAGAPTLIQDEATSVVWGMPGSAAKLGAADIEVPIEGMAAAILERARAMDSTATYQVIEV